MNLIAWALAPLALAEPPACDDAGIVRALANPEQAAGRNLRSRLVLEVKGGAPSLSVLVMRPFEGDLEGHGAFRFERASGSPLSLTPNPEPFQQPVHAVGKPARQVRYVFPLDAASVTALLKAPLVAVQVPGPTPEPSRIEISEYTQGALRKRLPCLLPADPPG